MDSRYCSALTWLIGNRRLSVCKTPAAIIHKGSVLDSIAEQPLFLGGLATDFNEARDDGLALAQVDVMKIICALLQTVNYSDQSIFTGQMLLRVFSQQCQCTV